MTTVNALIVSNLCRKISTLRTIKHLIEGEENLQLHFQLKTADGNDVKAFLFKDNYLSLKDSKIFLSAINEKVEELEKRLEEM